MRDEKKLEHYKIFHKRHKAYFLACFFLMFFSSLHRENPISASAKWAYGRISQGLQSFIAACVSTVVSYDIILY